MLEKNHSAQINELLATLPCEVQIPTEWGDYFSRHGILASTEEDGRRFARKHMPGKAILQITCTIPTFDRQQKVHKVYTRDISQGGISFLHICQLFPGEAGRLWLEDRRLSFEVVRCSRVNSQCYVIGASLAPMSDS